MVKEKLNYINIIYYLLTITTLAETSENSIHVALAQIQMVFKISIITPIIMLGAYLALNSTTGTL